MDDQPVLIAREGELIGQSWPINRGEFIIGRGHDCDIILPERQVSRHHVKIIKENGRFVLHDLGSKNGTHLNGRAFTGTAVLKDGDEIQIALCVKLAFIGTDATLPLTFEPPTREGHMVINTLHRSVAIRGEDLAPPLSLAQFRLLELLHDAHGAVCSRDAIVEAVWPGTEGIGVSEQAIDAIAKHVRESKSNFEDLGFFLGEY